MSTASAIPIPPQIISGFRKQIRSFIVHNGNRKSKTVMFGGTMMTVPDCVSVCPKSAKDADGDIIPGSYVMTDIYTFVPEFGEDILTFDAEKAVCHVLGIDRTKDGSATTASGPYALGGMSLLPLNPSKEEWQSIARSGEHRAYLASVEFARLVIQAWEETNHNRKKNGLDSITAGRAEREAQALIDRYNAEQSKVASAVPVPTSYAQELELEEIEISAIAEALAMKMAEKVADAQGVDSTELFKTLMDDPKVRAYAQKEFRIRRRGHQAISPEKLKAAADAGKTIREAGLEE